MPSMELQNRNQAICIIPEQFVPEDSPVRVIDAFVEGLDLEKCGIKGAVPAREGRPSYSRRSLLKLYIWGVHFGIRSCRKLALFCKEDIAVRWMTNGQTPEFRTIDGFFKDNAQALPEVFTEFLRKIRCLVRLGAMSIDGSKFQACNAKDNNFTANKLDDRIAWMNQHIEEFWRLRNISVEQRRKAREAATQSQKLLPAVIERSNGSVADQQSEAAIPGLLSPLEYDRKLIDIYKRLKKYEGYRKEIEQTGQAQKSTNDPESRLMKNKNGYIVAYNLQTAIDSNTHLMLGFMVTNAVTDHGQIYGVMSKVKSNLGLTGALESIEDQGYQQDKDIIRCLEHDFIPNVILPDGKDHYDLWIFYRPCTEEEAQADPCKALHSGRIPEHLRGVLSDMKVTDKTLYIKGTDGKYQKHNSLYGTPEEMMARAKEGYFVRDPERNLVYCPACEVLRQKCIKKNGDIRYCNKTGCRRCKFRNMCYQGKNDHKEIDFSKDDLEKPCKNWQSENANKGDEKDANSESKKTQKSKKYKIHVKAVVFRFTPRKNLMAQRLCLSEHPFGTIKRGMNCDYFLRTGMTNVAGEFALMGLGYNITRATHLFGVQTLTALLRP